MHSHTTSHWAAVCAALFAFAVMIGATPAAAQKAQTTMRIDTIKIQTASGEQTFQVEITETDADKARGLMFRTSLADTAGMLFPYAPAQEITMWMRNTYIPLDMLFIRSDGVIHRIEVNTEPLSERTIASNGDIAAVLELAGGATGRLGIKAGDRVIYHLFRSSGAK